MSFNDNADDFEDAMKFTDGSVETKRLASNTVVVKVTEGRVTAMDDNEIRMVARMFGGDVERPKSATWKVTF